MGSTDSSFEKCVLVPSLYPNTSETMYPVLSKLGTSYSRYHAPQARNHVPSTLDTMPSIRNLKKSGITPTMFIN